MEIVGPEKSLVITMVHENGLSVTDGSLMGWIDILNLSWGNDRIYPPDRYRVGDKVRAVVYHVDSENRFYASIKHALMSGDPFDPGSNMIRKDESFVAEVVGVYPSFELVRFLPEIVGILPVNGAGDRHELGSNVRVRVTNIEFDKRQVFVKCDPQI